MRKSSYILIAKRELDNAAGRPCRCLMIFLEKALLLLDINIARSNKQIILSVVCKDTIRLATWEPW